MSNENNNTLKLVISQNKYFVGKKSYDSETKEIWLIDAVEFTVLVQQNGQIGVTGFSIGDMYFKKDNVNNIYCEITKKSIFYSVYYKISSGLHIESENLN